MNGYKNAATYHVKLDIDNDRNKHEMWEKEAIIHINKQASLAQLPPDRSDRFSIIFERATITLAETLKECYDVDFSNMQLDLSRNNTVFGTLLGNILAEVDWFQIAKELIEDLD